MNKVHHTEMILFLTNDPKTVKHLVKLVSLGVYLPSFMRIVHSQSPFSGAPENTNELHTSTMSIDALPDKQPRDREVHDKT